MARLADSGGANSALIDSEWPVKTGTRTQVPDTSRSGMSRILRDSLRSFCSSSVSLLPSSTIEPASGRTLNAIGRDVLRRRRELTAEPSWASRGPWSPAAAIWPASSSTPASPLPDTAW